MRSFRLARTLAFVSGLILAGIAAAQTADPPEPPPESAPSRPDTFGTDCCETLQISAAAFVPRASDIVYGYGGDGYVTVTANPHVDHDVFWAPVELPSGARIRAMDFYYFDDDAVNDIEANLRAYTGVSSPGLTPIASAVSSGSSGYLNAVSGIFDYTVVNGSTQLAVVVNVTNPSTHLRFKGAAIHWQRQISAAPLEATFGDVPTNYTYFRAIEALAASGITGGCGNGNFCPEQFVKRGEMAAFLARALGLHFAHILE
jgi:hypothetical protein